MISICFEPRDVWIGVFWRLTYRREHARGNSGSIISAEDLLSLSCASNEGSGPISRRLEVFVCLLPCFPLRIVREWRV